MSKVIHSYNRLSKFEKQKFFNIIIQNNDVNSLYLPTTVLTNEDCKKLANAIITNGKIIRLDLSRSEFTKTGFTMIVGALQKAKNAVDLNILYTTEECSDRRML